jgi:hypothetical protein
VTISGIPKIWLAGLENRAFVSRKFNLPCRVINSFDLLGNRWLHSFARNEVLTLPMSSKQLANISASCKSMPKQSATWMSKKMFLMEV